MDAKLYKTYEKIEQDHWWFHGRRKIIDYLLKRYHVGKGAKILDFGCNTGVLVNALQDKGFEAYGSDISSTAIEFGQSRGVKNLFCGSLPVAFHDDFFDVTLALDVIEHIEDDFFALKELARVTRKGGYIFVMVPAFMFMWGLQDVVAHHFRRYRKEGLVSLAEKLGLEVVRVSYFNFFLFLPIAVVRLIQKVIPPKRASDFELNNKAINWILTKLFELEASLVSKTNLPFGVSLLAVFKKND